MKNNIGVFILYNNFKELLVDSYTFSTVFIASGYDTLVDNKTLILA